MKSDNLFDTKFSFLDFVKIMLLVVTGFSTFNIVDIITPDGAFAVVREWAAVLVVEGAFIGFEWATSKARNQRQVTFATIGFFCSLLVIGLFAAASGLLEFGGKNLVQQPFGSVMGLSLTFGDAVAGGALAVLVVWILTLAAIYRFYSLNDPDMRMEIRQVALNESVDTEAENALKVALQKAAPTIASGRALASVQTKYAAEMSPAQMQAMMTAMSEALERSYAVKPDLNYRAPVKPISAMGQLGNALAGKVAGFAQRISGAIPADPDMPIIPKQLQVVAISAGSPAPKVEPTAEEVVEDFLSGLPEMTPFPTGEEAAEPEPLGELDDLLARAARASYEKNDEAARALFERAYGVAQTRGERERVHQLMTFRGLTEVVFRDQPFQKW